MFLAHKFLMNYDMFLNTQIRYCVAEIMICSLKKPQNLHNYEFHKKT